MPVPEIFRQETEAFKGLKSIWAKIKKSKVYKEFRSSKLNPYHVGVKKVVAEDVEKARAIIREKAKYAKSKGKKFRAQFIYNGTRYYADRYDCTPQQEYAQDGMVIRDGYDVSKRIPYNSKGELDLFAETPIVIAINPIEGPALIGHVCMQYEDHVLNRLLTSIHTDPLYPKYNEYAEYFFIYPSKIDINYKELVREIDKHNIKHGNDRYNPLSNNCAQNIARVLKKVGVSDFDFWGPDCLNMSYATPGNNPFDKGIKAWCHKHGLRARLSEMEEYNRRFPIPNVQERRDEMKTIRNRYRNFIKKGNERE